MQILKSPRKWQQHSRWFVLRRPLLILHIVSDKSAHAEYTWCQEIEISTLMQQADRCNLCILTGMSMLSKQNSRPSQQCSWIIASSILTVLFMQSMDSSRISQQIQQNPSQAVALEPDPFANWPPASGPSRMAQAGLSQISVQQSPANIQWPTTNVNSSISPAFDTLNISQPSQAKPNDLGLGLDSLTQNKGE